MKLEKIISLANNKTRLEFLVMERSLRAVGCQLPIWVIPYDNNRFELPAGSIWWEVPEIITWLARQNTHPTMRKYQCLTISNYQFVDADVCFIRNPEDALAQATGFITSCGHWHNPGETLTSESKHIMITKSTIWQQNVFNTGQFACDSTLYTYEKLKTTASTADFIATCLQLKWHEQPGINLLVNASNVTVSNLTLPPTRMESTWAGDYPGDYIHYWSNPATKPYLIHWAGGQIMFDKPINEVFYQYLTEQEKEEWNKELAGKIVIFNKRNKSIRSKARRVRKVIGMLFNS